ncbi:DUF4372 domain-containing protein [Sphingobacterium lumbrici]|uniref:DUF4372 domain-containing protein n=1 Tax=Sphingobacterium lumbrici TaxID=2559600 RepID=UPI0037433310
MNVFYQILGLLDRVISIRLVGHYQSDKHHKGINNWTHFISMPFCDLSSADSILLIQSSINSWRIFDIFYILVRYEQNFANEKISLHRR